MCIDGLVCIESSPPRIESSPPRKRGPRGQARLLLGPRFRGGDNNNNNINNININIDNNNDNNNNDNNNSGAA
jgi:hypothetical protein